MVDAVLNPYRPAETNINTGDKLYKSEQFDALKSALDITLNGDYAKTAIKVMTLPLQKI